MKYVLVKYKKLKLLINEGLPMQPLIDHLQDVVELKDRQQDFYANLVGGTEDDCAAFERSRSDLVRKIGYIIVGTPFDDRDAELYALDKGLDYSILELHGNTGKANAAKEVKKDSHIQMRVSREQKALWVKRAQSRGMKLADWITKNLNGEL